MPYRRVPHGGRVRGRGREGIVGFRFWLREKKGWGLEGSQGADPKDEDREDGEGEADGVEVEDGYVGSSPSLFLEDEVGDDEGDCGEEECQLHVWRGGG